MSRLITLRSGVDYDWQAEVIARIEREGGDPSNMELWARVCDEVAADEALEADDVEL